MPLLLAAVDLAAATRRPLLPAAVGAVAGFAMFLPMLGWVIAPAGYAGWVLLAATQSAWYALVAHQLRRWTRSGWVLVLAPLLWTAMEAWRAIFPSSGFGWGDLAYAHVHGSPLLGVARIGGGYGLTLLTALIGAGLWLALAPDARRRLLRLSGVGAGAAAVAVGVVAAPVAPDPTGHTVDVLAVQGNDLERPSADARADDVAIAERMLSETRRSVREEGRPELTVWPESSIDRDPFRESGADLLPLVQDAAATVGGQLLFGTNLDGPRPATFYNAAMLVDRDTTVVDRYVKRRYVPFGEYVPLRPLLGALPPLRQVPRDGVAGTGPHTIRADAVGVAVVICFETLFADHVRSNIRADGAGLLVAVTNDATFGRSAESAQHIAQTQLRAVETGRWAVHAALSGGSALIDPDGRVRVRTGLFERATIRADVPVITAETPFLRVGDVVGTTARWAGLAFLAYQLLERRRRRARRLQDAA